MGTIAVIPARFQSKRLPGKPLKELLGKTMVERVYERASRARRVDRVLVATDDPRILEAVEGFGGDAVMTSPSHPSGSDRIAEAVEGLDFELVVNVQGDEPLIDPEAIDDAVRLASETPGAIVSLETSIADRKTLYDPNVVKVVTDSRGFALYFSRAPLPFPPAGALGPNLYYKHIGLYVYPKPLLETLKTMPPSRLELTERLEQLRALEGGIPIRLAETDYDGVAVDTPFDLERVRRILVKGTGQVTVEQKP